MKPMALSLAFVCVLLSAAAQVLMKHGMTLPAQARAVDLYWHALGQPWVWTGLVLYGLSAVLWLLVLARLDLGVAYPMVSLGFVITWLVGIFALGESFSPWRLLAIGLIVSGVCLLAWKA